MKYIVVLCDGMSDLPIPELNGKTPMEVAHKPNMDKLARISLLGTAKTVQDNMKPGSDVANLSILGYDPAKCYTGRSPLEAGSLGIDMKTTDVSLRCNLVTLSPYYHDDYISYNEKFMEDYCAGDISTPDAKVLIDHIDENLGKPPYKFYSGVSYRHCLIWNNGTTDLGVLTPPHDISGKKITSFLSVNENGANLIDLMEKSHELLKKHPLNSKRINDGKRPANSIWLWGEGAKASLEPFKQKFKLSAAMISAVDLLKGIGKLSGMEVIDVPGATGYIDTNFTGKANAAINALQNGIDFVYIHIEAPDECGHRGEIKEKIRAIELIDELVLGTILEKMPGEPFKILICPDHPTPLSLKTHTNSPVPFLIYDSTKISQNPNNFSKFTEKTAEQGVFEPLGFRLINRFLQTF